MSAADWNADAPPTIPRFSTLAQTIAERRRHKATGCALRASAHASGSPDAMRHMDEYCHWIAAAMSADEGDTKPAPYSPQIGG